ncbi:MAG TPA: DNA primase [Nitriliruptorales bacterium]|nr:DNA primase [Nitriliruptorales bacterium]
MPGRILQEDVEGLKQRADLAEVVADHTNLRRAGSRLKGLCPFHQEKTPSFTVDPGQGFYHCFGCDEGGDVYTFLMKVEGLTFTEAVEQLARRVGYQLRYEELSAGQRRALGKRTRLVAANIAAADFFHRQLLADAGEPARAYLRSRGFGRPDADRFQLGFAPLEWDALSRHLTDERFSERELEEAGLAARTPRGGLRDRLRGRIVFPVLDLNGDVIGFGGRVVPGLDYGAHEPPKYLNTPETPLYRKHRVLYGMSWARPEVVRTGEVLVTEGYTDVIALHQAGLTNAVATCGTAVGEDHFRLLVRYAARVVLAFDSDAAGEKAAERASELSRAHHLQVRVLVMPPGKDPADTVREVGTDGMRTMVAAAEPLVRFMLRRATADHPATPEGRAAAVDASAGLLAGIDDPVLRGQYARVVADELTGVSVAAVADAVARAGSRLPTAEVHPPPAVTLEPSEQRELSARARLEREVLRIALQRPDLLPGRWAEVCDEDFAHPRARAVFAPLQAAGGPGAPLAEVLGAAADDEVRSLVRAIALEDFTVEPDPTHVAMLVGRLLLRRVERAIVAQKDAVQRLNPVVEPDRHRTEFERLIALEARRRDLREAAAQ